MTELKPCPFCGEKPHFLRHGTNRQSCIIVCENCGCSLETGETWNEGEEWNARANGWQSQGAIAIAAERQRQIESEGWTAEHDDIYTKEQLIDAADAYLYAAHYAKNLGLCAHQNMPPSTWPWSLGWWKPSSDPIRNLEKAGALIAAEIDRINRQNTQAAE